MEFQFETLLHGADYNYEQWLENPEIHDDDFRLMKKAGCNVMAVGIFSWSMLEPRDGLYDFTWMDRLLDRLDASGMKAILATPSGAKPAWLSQAYPEVRRVDATGRREGHGGRHNHCRTSAVFRRKCLDINTLLAERYGGHPALVAWHVSNEYNSGPCHCDLCLGAFQNWLKVKYGSLDALNTAWWTTFWSHRYTDWNQILPGDPSVHALGLDWMRFISDQSIDFFLAESEPLRRLTPKIPITTNFMKPDVGMDYWKFAQHLDLVSWDSYPKWHQEEPEWREGVRTGFYHDYFRSLKGRPFMLMESSPDVTNWQGLSLPKKGSMHFLASLQAVAHGSDTVQYFQWRQSRGGEEKFHSAVVSHAGHEDTRVFRNVTKVGEALGALKDVVGAETDAKVALIYDVQNEWALNLAQLPRNEHKDYQERCMVHYEALWSLGVAVDVVDPGVEEFSSYAVVIAPMLYLLREGFAQVLHSYVEQGGTLVTTYLSGLVDQNDLCFLGGAPGPLRDITGLWVEETDTLDERYSHTVRWSGKDYGIRHYADVVRPDQARTEGVFTGGVLENHPAILSRSLGEGRSLYLAARFENEFYVDFYRELMTSCGFSQRGSEALPEGVTVRIRRKGAVAYAFWMNFTDREAVIDLENPDQEDALTGDMVTEMLSLPPYGMRVLRSPAEKERTWNPQTRDAT